jgi:Na+-transporting methylmalonyl-CoA/oxaloacetate decarboxylase gamma subunit
MKNDLDIKSIQRKADVFLKKAGKHMAFAAVMIVLLAYIFVVWKISKFSTAEPSASAEAAAATQIPKIDQNAIKQIQALEQSNTEVRSLFNSARNNPFQE